MIPKSRGGFAVGMLYPYMGWILAGSSFLILVLFAAFFQRMACGICGEGLPTFKKAVLIAAVTLVVTYFAWDFTGFFLVRYSKEAFRPELRPLIQNLTYSGWFGIPLNLKTEAISCVPMVSKIPYIFAICVAGICTVAGLTVTFRIGIVILVLQVTMTLVCFAVLNFLAGFGAHFFIRKFPKEAAEIQAKISELTRPAVGGQHAPVHGKEIQTKKQDQLGKNLTQHVEGKGEVKAAEPEVPAQTENQASPAGQLMAAFYQHYLEASALTHPYLEKINESLSPLSSHLPSQVRSFLESGGWWLAIGLALIILVKWFQLVSKRIRKAFKSHKSVRSKPKKISTIKLDELGPVITSPGRTFLTLKNIPGRVRVFVMSPAGSDSGELHTEMAPTIADHIKPGLGEIVDHDYPLVEVWNRQYSAAGFPFTFFSTVVSPDAKGSPSNWSLVAGTVSLGKFKVQVGLAVEFLEKNNLARLEVKPDQWLDVLDIRKS